MGASDWPGHCPVPGRGRSASAGTWGAAQGWDLQQQQEPCPWAPLAECPPRAAPSGSGLPVSPLRPLAPGELPDVPVVPTGRGLGIALGRESIPALPALPKGLD